MIEARIEQRFPGFALAVDFASTGPVLGVFGRSGSGKTTLLHCLAGLLRPAAARIVVDGVVLADGRRQRPPEQRRLALVPQHALLFPHLSTRANLTFAPGAEAELQSPRGQRIVEVLRLGGLLGRRVATLSGGERQRIALGRALLARPRLLLLDEPAASLDVELQREVLALLQQSRQELGVAMLFVTHRPADLLTLADDCIVLEQGAVVGQGPPLVVLASARQGGLTSLVGVDNLLRLPLLRDDVTAGTSWLDLGGQALCVPWCGGLPGRPIDIGLYAQDVILCKQAPSATSARNALTCRVTALSSIGREVLVTVMAGATPLCVRITSGAATELGLDVGESVVALIKTTACHLLAVDAG